jgi:hypothetical protein
MGMRGPGARPMKERRLRPDFVEREKALKVLARQDAKAAYISEVKGLPAPAPLLPKTAISTIPWMAPDPSWSERVSVLRVVHDHFRAGCRQVVRDARLAAQVHRKMTLTGLAVLPSPSYS